MKRIFFILLLGFSPISIPCFAMTQFSAFYQSQNKRFGYVIKKVCGATFTKEDDKLFAKLAAKSDYDAIDRMIKAGRIVVLKQGEKVQILEKGIFTTKIKRANGQILYVSREDVKEQ